MKTIFKPMLFTFFIMLSMVSCSDEEVFIEPTVEIVDDTDTDPIVNTSLPCDFTLTNVEANATVIIDCILDLEGQTVNLPDNVSIIYEGGDIINGTLNFSEGNIISGELLNSSLALVGSSTPQLEDPVFNFIPSRWEIVEGETTSEIALNNKNILQYLLEQTKTMGATTFQIDRLNAYFEVGNINNLSVFRSVDHAISIPSDFILKMGDETYLRVFPNSSPNYALMAIYESENVTIDGGNLIGDRDRHDYSSGGPHEHGHCLQIRSGNGITIKNVNFSYGSGDGIDINSVGFSFQSNYNPSSNITITNNVFDTNRRNNISVTDGRNIIIENNEILNAGIDTNLSTGVDPGAGIDIEAVRDRNNLGELVFYQIAKDIIIRNNSEKGSKNSAFIVAIGQYVTIENNVTENSIGYSFAHNVTITGNELTSISSSNIIGISAGKLNGGETIYNNEISNNIVNGFSIGIFVYNRDAIITENTFKEFITGILVSDIKNIEISNNIFTSSKLDSRGIFLNSTNLENVNFSDNTINVVSNPFTASNINTGIGEGIIETTVLNNDFNSSTNAPILFSNSKGLNLIGNKIETGIQIFNSKDLSFSLNDILTNNNNGIYLREINENITLDGNFIEVDSNYECIIIQSTTNINEVINTNNICN
ncbi:MAG: hypothetical protein L3J25_02165 [Flavobacteriaceae bacterium]|nr:hypothetical protein [Flavobacteriaceae bacterium]